MKDKLSLAFYRYHNDKAEALTALSSRPEADFKDGTYYADVENNIIYVYSDQFSTYCAAYSSVKTPATGDTSLSPIYWIMTLSLCTGLTIVAIRKRRDTRLK